MIENLKTIFCFKKQKTVFKLHDQTSSYFLFFNLKTIFRNKFKKNMIKQALNFNKPFFILIN